MSQLSLLQNVASRRRLLAFAIGVATVPIAERAIAHDKGHETKVNGTRSTRTKVARSQKTIQTAAALRDLWLGHIFWVRNVSVAAINKNDLAVRTAEQKVVDNAKAIAATIGPFYGAAAEESFFKLLAGHYSAVKAFVVATAATDTSAQATATQSLTSNAEEIAVLLSRANRYLPKDAVQGLLLAHAGHHIQQVQQLKDHQYEAEARTWEEMKQHVFQIADVTADALAKQFAKKFT